MTADSSLAHPPKARLAVRVGVTGHRPNRLPASDEGLLRARIRVVLQTVATTTQRVFTEFSDAYAAEPPALRVVSALAEGADRLVAEEALALDYELHCPLPFVREEYARDFATESARTAYNTLLDRATAVLELVNDRSTPQAENEAYEAAGRLMLQQSDVLIVIWNGAVPAGPGGTGQIVREALLRRIPCVWIHSDAPHLCGLLGETDITDTGSVTGTAESRLVATSDWTVLEQRLRDMLSPPSPPDHRLNYFAETPPKSALFGIWFTLFHNLLIGRWQALPLRYPEILQTTLEEWRKIRNAAPEPPAAVDQQIENHFCHHYAWADKLANYYADLYRSSFVLNYLFSAVAVTLALLSFAWSGMMQSATGHGIETRHAVAYGVDSLVAGELILILVIITGVVLGKRYRWHERWIEYRLLAEQFRQMRLLALLGRSLSSLHLAAHHTSNPADAWMHWHSRAVARATGLLHARIDTAYLEACRRRLIGGDRGLGEIQDQIHYHQHNFERLHTAAHRLHCCGLALFGLTVVVCIDHLFLHGLPLSVGMVLAGAAPAFGAALAGILIQGEFERLAKRSKAMEHTLTKFCQTMRVEQCAPTFGHLGRVITYVTDTIMMNELIDWKMVVLERPLMLPG